MMMMGLPAPQRYFAMLCGGGVGPKAAAREKLATVMQVFWNVTNMPATVEALGWMHP
jgi:hypothetical protein